MPYRLDFPLDVSFIHPIFHLSMLRKLIDDHSSILPLEGVEVEESLTYQEVLVEILDKQVKRLRNRNVASVKMLWRNQLICCQNTAFFYA